MTLNHRIARGFAGALFASAFAAAPALAQSADPFAPRGADAFDRAMEGAPAPDPKLGQLDELAKEIGAQPIPATDASGPAGHGGISGTAAPQPMAPTAATPPASSSPFGALAGGSGPAGDSMAVDNSVEINGNYDATVDIYQNILDKQGTDPANLDRRIQANEEMIAKYRPALVRAETELRKMQVEFMNRAFQLKQQKESGQITEDMFSKLIQQEEMKSSRKKDGLAQDCEFYKDEIVQATTRLKELKEQRKLVAEKAKREGKEPPKKKAPGEALFQGFSKTLDQLSGFNTRFTMDGNVKCRSCNEFHGVGAQHGQQQGQPATAPKEESEK